MKRQLLGAWLPLILACSSSVEPSKQAVEPAAPQSLPEPVETSTKATQPDPASPPHLAPGAGPTDEAVAASVARARGGEGFNQKDYPPDFALKVLANGGGEQRLSSLVGSSPTDPVEGVVIAFVASWCGRCKESYPTLEALQQEHGDKLRILLLTAETDEEGKGKMVEVVKKAGLTLPLLDVPPDLVDLWLGTKKNIPRYFLLDYKGMVRVKDTGFGAKMKGLLPNQVAWLLERHAQETSAGTAIR